MLSCLPAGLPSLHQSPADYVGKFVDSSIHSRSAGCADYNQRMNVHEAHGGDASYHGVFTTPGCSPAGTSGSGSAGYVSPGAATHLSSSSVASQYRPTTPRMGSGSFGSMKRDNSQGTSTKTDPSPSPSISRTQSQETGALALMKEAETEPILDTHYISGNCVLLFYFSGDVGHKVDEHFTKSLNHASFSPSLGGDKSSSLLQWREISPMASRNFPASFWNAHAQYSSHHNDDYLFPRPHHHHNNGAAAAAAAAVASHDLFASADPYHAAAAAHHLAAAAHQRLHHQSSASDPWSHYPALAGMPTTGSTTHTQGGHYSSAHRSMHHDPYYPSTSRFQAAAHHAHHAAAAHRYQTSLLLAPSSVRGGGRHPLSHTMSSSMTPSLDSLKGEPSWSDAAYHAATDHLSSTELTHALSLNAAANFNAGGSGISDHETTTAKDLYSWF